MPVSEASAWWNWFEGSSPPRDIGLAVGDWSQTGRLGKPPLVVQTALRLGAYQILHLDKIPESAAVNESVRLVKMQAKRVGRD
ncbi:MAG: transcription antitermination factor NusB [Nitrospiraceae bacterium]